MVKSSLVVSAITALLVAVNAQTPTLPGDLGNFGSSIPTDLSAAAAAASSLLKNNPSAIQSLISQASAQASLIPSQYQASYYSVVAEASKSANAIQAKNTSPSTTNSAGEISHPVTFAVCALTIVGVLASLL